MNIKEDIQLKAIELVKNEKTAWDTGSAFVTENVSFEMRNVLKRSRKNYYGIFDKPYDTATGLEKIWVPLTEWTVETYVKNIDLDTKDINIRATKPLAVRWVNIVRQILKNYLKRLGFGELLDDGQRNLSIDGTWVQKSFKGYDPQLQKETLKTSRVDLLNFWIDPMAKDIQSAYSCIERVLMPQTDIKQYKSWINTETIKFKREINPNEENLGVVSQGQTPVIDIYERWGKMPKYLITGRETDKNVWIDGMIIVSGLGSGKALCHKILENKKARKPYDEVWLKRVPGRWYGRGIAESLFGLQMYVNEIVNSRRLNNLILQNRLFEIRKGSGITPQMLSKLVAGGGIPVTAIGQDIKELPTTDARQSSYIDEKVIYQMADRTTGAFEISRGETLPASMPATNAVIQNTNAKSSYVLVQEGIGMFLKRLIEKQWLPIIFEVISSEEIVNILGDKEIREFDEIIIKEKIEEWIINSLNATGWYPEGFDIDQKREELKTELTKLKKNRFVGFKKSLVDVGEYEIDIYVTNEDFDKGVMIQNLDKMLTVYSKLTTTGLDVDMIIAEVLDIMGLGSERFFLKEKVVKPAMGIPRMTSPTPQEQFAQANLPINA